MKLLALALLALAGGGISAGVRAYREGRYEQAHEALARAAEEAGESAPAELLHDLALAALRTGSLSAAVEAAERAARRAKPELAPACDFLLGNVAFARAELAALQASGPEAEPFAFDVALALAERARLAWERAATSRADWPQARRNVERALLLLEDLRARQAEARTAREKEPDAPPPEPELLEPPEAEPITEPGEEEAAREPELAPLAPEELTRILERLALKEREKQELRSRRRSERSSDLEKDW